VARHPAVGQLRPSTANIALDGLEAVLAERFGSTAKSINRFRVRSVRYADDFIITGNSKDLLEHEVKPCVEAFLVARDLELSQEKTKITHISEGFDFLEQNVRKYNGKLLIKPSARNVKAFLDNIRETIRANRSAKQETLIALLTPMIRGWANYHRHVVAKTTYVAVDFHIWQALWHWARRRHPNKSGGWVRRRYFRTLGHSHWVFATTIRGYNDESRFPALRFGPRNSDRPSRQSPIGRQPIRSGLGYIFRDAETRANVATVARPQLPQTALAAARGSMSRMRSTHRR
jgi:RNA-directed DNA polymerase